MKVQIITDYQGISVDSCIRNLNLKTGNITNLDFSNDEKLLDEIFEEDYDRAEIQDIYYDQDNYYTVTILQKENGTTHSFHTEIVKKNEEGEPTTLKINEQILKIFNISHKKQISLKEASEIENENRNKLKESNIKKISKNLNNNVNLGF